MKAQRQEDGRIVLFRPDLNAKRMQLGAERMCMPAPTVEQFVEAVKETTQANKRWVLDHFSNLQPRFESHMSEKINVLLHGWLQVPPFGKGSLYMRPMLLGSGAMLGVAPAPEYTYLIYSSPVGNYFKVSYTSA